MEAQAELAAAAVVGGKGRQPGASGRGGGGRGGVGGPAPFGFPDPGGPRPRAGGVSRPAAAGLSELDRHLAALGTTTSAAASPRPPPGCRRLPPLQPQREAAGSAVHRCGASCRCPGRWGWWRRRRWTDCSWQRRTQVRCGRGRWRCPGMSCMASPVRLLPTAVLELVLQAALPLSCPPLPPGRTAASTPEGSHRGRAVAPVPLAPQPPPLPSLPAPHRGCQLLWW